MDYNIQDLNDKYHVVLDNTQEKVLSDILDFVESGEQSICLTASAGTGKSTILKMIYDILSHNNISCIFVAPTNKSKFNLNAEDSYAKAKTIHALLGLKPDIDILEFDASQLFFDFNPKKQTEVYSVLLIDECSMINDDLYNTLCKKFKDSKLIFCGDPAQLAPVKQNKKSLAFNSRVLSLTKIYRQTESPLYRVLEYLRHKPLYTFKNVSSNSGNIIVCNNILDMINSYSYLFKLSKDFNDRNLVKLITYTNNRIDALNKIIRKCLYKDDEEYHVGEVLTGYDSCAIDNLFIDNSRDYIITKVTKSIILINAISFNAYLLNLKSNSDQNEMCVNILSRNNDLSKLNILAEYLENKRQDAHKSSTAVK